MGSILLIDVHSLPLRYLSVYTVIFFLIQITGISNAYARTDINGFVIDKILIPESEIYHGGPSRDGIPAIDSPEFVPAASVSFLADGDRVLGLTLNGASKAYPVKILNWHELVNDTLATQPVVISYCPLCGTGMAFSARIAGTARSFGVSGLLYNSDMLLYDRETESLWSQIMGQAISGQLMGTQLEVLPLEYTTWRDWRNRNPDTLVLSRRTGYSRNYDQSPYGDYVTNSDIYFPVSYRDRRYHPKEQVIGVEINGVFKAYPFVELSKNTDTEAVSDSVGGISIIIEYDSANRTGRVLREGKVMPSLISYWFAWIAFHPDTKVYQAP